MIRKPELVHRPLCSKPCNRSKPAAPGTLLPCQVTVTAQQPLQFWQHVKKKAAKVGRPIFSTLEKISLPKISDMQIVDVLLVMSLWLFLCSEQLLIQDEMIVITFLHGRMCKTSKQRWLTMVLILQKCN